MKKLVALISTEGKSKEQIVKETTAAIKKFNKVFNKSYAKALKESKKK